MTVIRLPEHYPFEEELHGLIGKRARFEIEPQYRTTKHWKDNPWVDGVCEIGSLGTPMLNDGRTHGRWVLSPERLLRLELLE